MKTRPKLDDFNADELSSQQIKSELNSLKKEEGTTPLEGIVFAVVFVGICFYVVRYGDAFIAGLIFIAGLPALIASIFIKWFVNAVFYPDSVIEKKRREKDKSRLEQKLTNRINYERALADWEFLNLVSKSGYWLEKKGSELEKEIAKLLEGVEWLTELTPKSGDEGIDLICTKDNATIFIQAKGHAKPLGVAAIRDAAGVKMAEKPDEMVVVCPSGFTKGSMDFAEKSGVKLISANELAEIARGEKDII